MPNDADRRIGLTNHTPRQHIRLFEKTGRAIVRRPISLCAKFENQLLNRSNFCSESRGSDFFLTT